MYYVGIVGIVLLIEFAAVMGICGVFYMIDRFSKKNA